MCGLGLVDECVFNRKLKARSVQGLAELVVVLNTERLKLSKKNL